MELLTENTLYVSNEEKQELLKDNKVIADIVFLNYIGFLALYSINLKGRIKQYRFIEGKINQAKDIEDTNTDVSVSLKLAQEAGLFTNVTLIRYTKVVQKIKQGSLKPKDITNDFLKELYTLGRFGTTVKLRPKVKAIANKWLSGEIEMTDIPKEIYKISKMPEYKALLGDYYTFYKRSDIDSFYNKQGKDAEFEIMDSPHSENLDPDHLIETGNWNLFFTELHNNEKEYLSKPVDTAWRTKTNIQVKNKLDEYIAKASLMYRNIPNVYRSDLNDFMTTSFKRNKYDVKFWKSDFTNSYNNQLRDHVISNIKDNIKVLISTSTDKYNSNVSKLSMDEVRKIHSLLKPKDYEDISLEFYSELDRYGLFDGVLLNKFLNHFAIRINQNDITPKALKLFFKYSISGQGNKKLVDDILNILAFVLKSNAFGMTETDKVTMIFSAIQTSTINKSQIMDKIIKLYMTLNEKNKIPKRILMYLMTKTDDYDLILNRLLNSNAKIMFSDEDIKFYTNNLPSMSKDVLNILVNQINDLIAGSSFSEAELTIRNKNYIKLAMFANNVLKYYNQYHAKVEFKLDKGALYQACQKIVAGISLSKYLTIDELNLSEINDMIDKFEFGKRVTINESPMEMLSHAVNNGDFNADVNIPIARTVASKSDKSANELTKEFYKARPILKNSPFILEKYTMKMGDELSFYIGTATEAKLLSRIMVDNPYIASLEDTLKLVTKDVYYLMAYDHSGYCITYYKCKRIAETELENITK